MTDPERISSRASGLAAQLLQAGAAELPSEAGLERTLSALCVSGVVLGTTSAAASGAKATTAALAGAGTGASTGGAIATSAGGVAKVTSAVLLVKWIGIGVVGGVGLAGAAAVVTGPSATDHTVASQSAPRVVAAPVATPTSEVTKPSVVETPAPAAPVVAPVAPHVSATEPAPAAAVEVDEGAPLAAEVAFVDRARTLLAGGQAERGLALLGGYEAQFPEARLLPEVLFLRLETDVRLGHDAEARAAAQRLVDNFPQSPHASRARKLLGL